MFVYDILYNIVEEYKYLFDVIIKGDSELFKKYVIEYIEKVE